MELEDIKSYLRIDGDEEDGLLRIMIDAGKEFIRSAVGASGGSRAEYV